MNGALLDRDDEMPVSDFTPPSESVTGGGPSVATRQAPLSVHDVVWAPSEHLATLCAQSEHTTTFPEPPSVDLAALPLEHSEPSDNAQSFATEDAACMARPRADMQSREPSESDAILSVTDSGLSETFASRQLDLALLEESAADGLRGLVLAEALCPETLSSGMSDVQTNETPNATVALSLAGSEFSSCSFLWTTGSTALDLHLSYTTDVALSQEALESSAAVRIQAVQRGRLARWSALVARHMRGLQPLDEDVAATVCRICSARAAARQRAAPSQADRQDEVRHVREVLLRSVDSGLLQKTLRELPSSPRGMPGAAVEEVRFSSGQLPSSEHSFPSSFIGSYRSESGRAASGHSLHSDWSSASLPTRSPTPGECAQQRVPPGMLLLPRLARRSSSAPARLPAGPAVSGAPTKPVGSRRTWHEAPPVPPAQALEAPLTLEVLRISTLGSLTSACERSGILDQVLAQGPR